MKQAGILLTPLVAVSLTCFAETEIASVPADLVGSWKRPNQSVYVKIFPSGEAFQCRLSGDIQNVTFFTASGKLSHPDTVKWDDMVMVKNSRKTFVIDDKTSDRSRFTWGIEKTGLEKGRLILDGKYGRWEYESWPDLPDRCKSYQGGGTEQKTGQIDSTKLPPLPANESSEYLVTRTVDWAYLEVDGEVAARYSIVIGPQRALPAGAYLEVSFENPDNPNKPILVSLPRGAEQKSDPFVAYSGTDVGSANSSGSPWIHGYSRWGEKSIQITSPEVRGVKCRNYRIIIDIYDDSSKAHMLGKHEQMIWSGIDAGIVKSTSDVLAARAGLGVPCRFSNE